MEKPKKSYSLNELGNFMSSTGGGVNSKNDKKFEKLLIKEKAGSKEEPLKKLTTKEKAKYKYFSTYDDGKKGVSNPDEEHIPSDEYKEHRKNKIKDIWRNLGKNSEKLLENIHSSEKSPIYTLPENNKTNILTRTEKPEQVLTYTSVIHHTATDDGIINPSNMPEKNKPELNKNEIKTPDAEDLKLQAVIDHEIKYWREKLPGSKPRDLMDFKIRPFNFIEEALENRRKKLIAEKTRLELIANKKSADSKEISKIDNELNALDYNLAYIKQAIKRKIPHPTDEFFTLDKQKIPPIEFEKIKEGSIISIIGGKRYRITGVEGDEVTYYDMANKNSPEKIKLNYLQKMMLQPRAKIFTTATPKKQLDTIIAPDAKATGYTIDDVDKMKKDLELKGVGLSSPLLIKRYLKDVSTEEAQNLYDEYNKLHGRDNLVEPADINLEPVKSKEPAQVIEQSEKFLNLMKEIEALETRKKELEENIERAVKESFIPKPEDSSRLIGWEPSKFTAKLEEIKINQASKPEAGTRVFEMGSGREDDLKVNSPYISEEIKANSTGVINLTKEDIEKRGGGDTQEHTDNSLDEYYKSIEFLNVPKPPYVEGDPENISQPVELDIRDSSLKKETAESSKNRFGGAELKEELNEILIEKGFDIKNPKFMIGQKGFRVEGMIKNKIISMGFTDSGLGLMPIEKNNINIYGGRPLGIFTKAKAIKEANRIVENFVSSIKEHFEKKLGSIDSINFIKNELVLNLNKE